MLISGLAVFVVADQAVAAVTTVERSESQLGLATVHRRPVIDVVLAR